MLSFYIEAILSIILIILFSIIIPISTYKCLITPKFENKNFYKKPILLITISISVSLFVPMAFWKLAVMDFLRCVFSNYKNYSEFIIALFGIHSIIQYFISKSNSKNLSQTTPFAIDQSLVNYANKNNLKYVNFKIVPKFKNTNYKFALDDKNQLLLVYDVSHSGTGDNLWFPMNEWYSRNQPINKFKQMPLWNYLSFDKDKQEEWVNQLNKFIEYLKNTNQIEKDEKITEQLVSK